MPLTYATHTITAALGCFLIIGCDFRDWSETPSDPGDPPASTGSAPEATIAARNIVVTGPFRLVDVAAATGLRFLHVSPLTKQRHIHLVMGSGIGWTDFDRDGWPDLYCCQGAAFDERPPSQGRPTNILYHNREGLFSDVTQRAGLVNTEYSMGIAVADFDNDGFADLCVTGYERNFLYHNNGDGSFTAIALPDLLQAGRLSAGAAWSDIDSDGNLDLLIVNYAKLRREDYPLCEQKEAGKVVPIACHPSKIDPLGDRLYRNTGAGRFLEVTAEAGLSTDAARPGLGVVAADFDQDGDPDFYVANDGQPNQLWENIGAGKFIDRGGESGSATNRHGAREAGMGLAAGDVDGNGYIDLFVTNYFGETNTLYRNQGNLLLSDVTEEYGLAAPSRLRLGFGTSLLDIDNDSWLDLVVVNGHVHDQLEQIKREGPFAQRPLLFRNEQGRRFTDVSASSGDYFRKTHVGRSTAVADFDRDGDADLAVLNLNSPVALLANALPDAGRWLRIELVGVESNRSGVGTSLQIDLGDRTIVRWQRAGSGYLSSDESSMLVGIGQSETVIQITARWPSGLMESWRMPEIKQTLRLVEGGGDVNRKDRD